MMFGVSIADVVGPVTGGIVGAILMAASNAYTRYKKANTDATVRVTEAETDAKVKADKSAGELNNPVFNEMKLLLRGQTIRITELDSELKEMRAVKDEEIRELRDDVTECKTERAALTERVKILEELRDNRTKSDLGAITKPGGP